MEKYVKVRVLGKGSFGSATLIKRKADDELFVVKEVNMATMNAKEKEEARQEVRVLQRLNHPNIIRFIEHMERRGILYIIMEYADGGDLHSKLKECQRKSNNHNNNNPQPPQAMVNRNGIRRAAPGNARGRGAGNADDRSSVGMPEPMIIHYLAQMCLALEYLHSRHILHRDIKTMNVFLDLQRHRQARRFWD